VCGSLAQAGKLTHQDVQLRLEQPIASYTRPGTPFSARVVGPVDFGERSLLPKGTVVHGIVRSSHGIGFGIRRERTTLELAFDSCELPWGEPIACELQLLTIDNARETVRSGNRILGILAASNPQSWMSGVWFKPAEAVHERRLAGLTGTVGALQNHLAPSPIGAGILLATRLALFRMPEVHIQLPAGTDLLVRLTAHDAPEVFEPLAYEPPPLDLTADLAGLPVTIARAAGGPVQDILNMAFSGTQGDIIRAFDAAGWSQAEPLTKGTFTRTWTAVNKMESYPTAPVSLLMWQGRPPEMVYQRSLNSLAQRHHIRLWRVRDDLWVGAATHDVEIQFRVRKVSFSHKIDAAIDRERSKVLNDLTEVGAVEGISLIERPGLARSIRNSWIETDGAIALARLRKPLGRAPGDPDAKMRPPHELVLKKAARRMVLETRHYLTRGSYFYWGYRSVRWGWSSSLRRFRNTDEQQNCFSGAGSVPCRSDR